MMIETRFYTSTFTREYPGVRNIKGASDPVRNQYSSKIFSLTKYASFQVSCLYIASKMKFSIVLSTLMVAGLVGAAPVAELGIYPVSYLPLKIVVLTRI